jgi:hypothetical protein
MRAFALSVTKYLVPLFGVVFMPVTQTAWAAPYAGLSPHKAHYELEMISRKNGNPIVNVTGSLIFELKNDCEAWISTHQLDITYHYAESPPIHLASELVTYEPFDGTSLDYNARRFRDDELVEEVRGHADMNPKTLSGKATYSLPEEKTYDLVNTSLPMQHTIKLRDAMKSGKRIYSQVVFDGSEGNGPLEINAVIGKKVNPRRYFTNHDDLEWSLLDNVAHHIRLAFFPDDSQLESPEYEMTALLHENGIISDLIVDYPDLSIHQIMTNLETVEDVACTKKRSRNPLKNK